MTVWQEEDMTAPAMLNEVDWFRVEGDLWRKVHIRPVG